MRRDGVEQDRMERAGRDEMGRDGPERDRMGSKGIGRDDKGGE